VNAAILDVRAPDQFEAGHRVGAVNIPLEQLAKRVHELPPSGTPLTIFDNDPGRAAAARELIPLNRWPLTLASSSDWLARGPLETGQSSARLWRPNDLLVEALPICLRAWGNVCGRRALDLACGTGRDAVYLAQSGFDVEAIDVLPDALERAADLARRNSVSVSVRCADLENGASIILGAYDLVTVFNFLHRPLLHGIRAAVRPNGFVVYEAFLKASRDAFGRPTRDSHLLNPGELAAAFADWRILTYREGLSGPRRIAAGMIAQKPI